MINDLTYQSIEPSQNLSDFVDSFWRMENKSDQTLETIGLPDGRIDLSLIKTAETPFQIRLLGAKENAPNLFEFSKNRKVLAIGKEQTIMYGKKGDDSLMFLLSSKIPENWIATNHLDFKNNQKIFE
ncbi:hypothetical protein [uncultured Flavobacterium sp.]|uniref:hypothetical protein n=1 Tax=uncultured Flavobacterium sp. TaxID=165435 RepID=UPI0025CC4A2C|nr:hypothetical protein [uncultured Flavobacterium sp.]